MGTHPQTAHQTNTRSLLSMLEANNIHFRYSPKRPLLSGISFQINPGEIWHLKGDNGAGKTTLMRGLMGLVNLTCDTLCLWRDSQPTCLRANTTFLTSESRGLFSYLSARQNLELFGTPGAESTNATKNAESTNATENAESTSTDHILDHWGFHHPSLKDALKVKHFSTGMKKRLTFARCQLTKRRLWLFDEPTSGLDSKGLQLLTDLMKQHSGMILFTSHHSSFSDSVSTHEICLPDKSLSHSPHSPRL